MRTSLVRKWILGAVFLWVGLQVPAALAIEPFLANNATYCADVQQLVRPGDLIFTVLNNPISRQVARATGSWTSHVGIVLPDETGQLVVFEAKPPLSRRSSICRFIQATEKTRMAIHRLRDREFTAFDIASLARSARARMGILYDIGFDYDNGYQYCSKLVSQVFAEALRISVGQIQTVRELIGDHPDPNQLRFWQLYFLGTIPYDRRMVTPASQLADPQFVTVYSHGTR